MKSNLLLFVVATAAVKLALVLPAASQTANVSPPQTVTRAETLIRQGEWDQGINLLTPMLARDPRNVQARNLLGIALTGRGDLLSANKEYRRVLQTQPHFVPALKNLAINELVQNQVESAVRDFRAALKLAPQDPVLHVYLGKIAYSQRNYPVAAEHLGKSRDLIRDPSVATELIDSNLQIQNPKQAREVLAHLDQSKIAPQWQFRLGIVLAQHQMFADAIPFFQRVAAGAVEAHDAAFDLAVCYVETKQFSQAIATLRAIAGQGPGTAELYSLLAEAYEGNQQTQEAIDTLREAVQLAPEDEDGFVSLAALCTKYEAYDIGTKVIDMGLQYHPKSDRLIFQRGVISALNGQFELAQKDFQLAAQLAPEKNLSYAALGVSYMQAGDAEKAIASLRQSLVEKPRDATLQFLLGQTLMWAGAQPSSPEFAEAQRALEAAVALDAKSVDSRVELAKVYLKDNRPGDAVTVLEPAREIDPRNNAVYLQLVIAYRRQGKPDLATAMLAKLNQLNQDDGKLKPNRRRLRMVQEDAPPAANNQ